MDNLETIMNEIQSLRKEIFSLKEQNTNLFNELSRQHKVLSDAIDFSISNHLKVHMPRFVGMQTAEFIINNMNDIRFIDDKAEYLRYVLTQTSNATWGGGI